MLCVIDDDPEDVTTLTALARAAYPEARVLPTDDATFRDWKHATAWLRQVVDDTEDTVLFLDLGLGQLGRQRIRTAMHHCGTLRRLFPHARLVAYTQYAQLVRPLPDFESTFNGLLNKQFLQSADTDVEQLNYVKQTTDAALPPQLSDMEHLFANACIVDSLGLRLFEAAFGVDTVYRLLSEWSSTWHDVQIQALNSGFSGTYLLRITGISPKGRESRIFKLCRERKPLQDELDAVFKDPWSLKTIGRHSAFTDRNVRRLTSENGFYFVQADAEGRELLEVVRGVDRTAAERAIGSLNRLLVECLDERKSDFRTLPLHTRLTLSVLDKARLSASVVALKPLSTALAARGCWPAGVPHYDVVCQAVVHVVQNWPAHAFVQEPSPHVLQHGDLNPRNVLVNANDLVLIDGARISVWPVGYDFARLTLQLTIRTMAHANCQDVFGDNFANWSVGALGATDAETAVGLPDEARQTVEAYRTWCDAQADPALLNRAFRVMTLWDAVKVVSYTDVSQFVRMWALMQCWKLASQCDVG